MGSLTCLGHSFKEKVRKNAVHFSAFPSFIQGVLHVELELLLVEHADATGGPLLERLLRPIMGEGPAQSF